MSVALALAQWRHGAADGTSRRPCRSDRRHRTRQEMCMKILIAVDGSRYTKRMLAYLAAHDELFGPNHDYTVVHVATPLPAIAAVELQRPMVRDFHAGASDAVFKPLRVFFTQHGLKPNFMAKVGRAGTVIAAIADKGKFDLVVMGSHGHSALGQLLLGSVTNEVLARCKAPVLVVR
jgi:nucleotide-binding universal stress UspA family protein